MMERLHFIFGLTMPDNVLPTGDQDQQWIPVVLAGVVLVFAAGLVVWLLARKKLRRMQNGMK